MKKNIKIISYLLMFCIALTQLTTLSVSAKVQASEGYDSLLVHLGILDEELAGS